MLKILLFPTYIIRVSRKTVVKAATLAVRTLQGQYTLGVQCVYHCFMKFKDIGRPMVKSSVISKRQQNGAMGAVGKGVLVGLLVSASALTQASPVTGQSVVLNENFSESSGSAGSVQATFITPANFSGAVSILVGAPLSKPAVTTALLAPPTIAPGPSASAAFAPAVSAPSAVVLQAVVPQQIVAAAPATAAVTPSTTAQPVVAAAPTTSGNTLPAPSAAVFAVPEPSTLALMFGGFIALIGIRRVRSANAK